MTAAPAVLTTERRLGAGRAIRAGSRAPFREVVDLEGEPHLVRGDLVGDAAPREVALTARAIACLAHLTDLHVTDAQSPARFEFINREWRDPRFAELLTMQRPQETLNTHAIAAMLRTIAAVEGGPLTRRPLDLAVMTGDAIDNTQRNELVNFLALMDGGIVHPDSGAPGYEGVQLPDWPVEVCWKPDGRADSDLFQAELGFPAMPGLLARGVEPFESPGLRVPWIGCYGNHEQVCQGVGMVTRGLARAMVGSRKAVALPEDLDRERAVEMFVENPEAFLAGPALDVAADPARRPVTRREFVDMHSEAGGHGFTAGNRDAGTAYHVYDAQALRFITLDTVCDAGGADGSVDPPQLHWLERRLEEAHSSFLSRDGTTVRTGHDDRLVVVLSHHGHDTLSNPRGEQSAGALLRLLHRFPNVVLWLNGHIHANRIMPRPDPAGGPGFWEVTTASLVDWPSQARIVELFEAGHGLLGIACTMIDHDGEDLAGRHRLLAANVPFNGFDSWRPGTPSDRNVILLRRLSF